VLAVDEVRDGGRLECELLRGALDRDGGGGVSGGHVSS
jgi:hypothetical protein